MLEEIGWEEPVLPARAGMIRLRRPSPWSPSGAPRESGDDPEPVMPLPDWLKCSPRERG